MRKEIQWFFLFFIFLECLNSDFTFQMAGFPYSIGKIGFIIIGVAYFPVINSVSRMRIIWATFFIYISYLVAVFFSDAPILDNLSPTIGMLILFLSSIGFGVYLFRTNEVRFLDIFFVVTFVYWSGYVLSNTVVGGGVVSYSTIDGIINHHVSGINIALGGLYIIFRYRFAGISILGISIAIFTLMVLFLSESRSNLIMFGLTYLLSFVFQYGSIFNLFKSISIVFILIVGIGYNAIFFPIFQNERVSERFDPTNQQYIEDTNISRVELYTEFVPSLVKNPFGKGLANPKVDTIYGEKLMHNKYATYIIKGGFLAVIPVVVLVFALVRLFMQSRKMFATHIFGVEPKGLKSVIMVLICYYLTLVTVDFGGLLDHFIYAITLYLFFSISRISVQINENKFVG